ncbi:kinase-like domain-containing protein [Mycena galericulata]|nr:kinase-like domain-containing protein [Mycena galericulata]
MDRDATPMDDCVECPASQEDLPDTQEQSQSTPPPRETRDPNLWGYLQRYPGNTLVPQERYDLYRNQPEVTIGRAPASTIRIPHLKISVKHATLRWKGVVNGVSRVMITDDGSTNHTFIDGTVVKPHEPRSIPNDAEISFAQPQPPPPGNDTMDDFRFIYHDLASPTRGVLEEFDLQEVIGRGCFGVVTKAYSRRDGTMFAVKSINPGQSSKDLTKIDKDRQAVLDEIKVMQALEHPNICKLQMWFQNPDQGIDIVLEFMAGGDLFAFIVKYGGLSERMTKHLMRQLCEALGFIHSQEITHRDLKPENVLLTTDRPPVLKIADFGLAKMVKDELRLSTICGTPMYLAPEFLDHIKHKTGYPRFTIDVYSAGGVMHNCVAYLKPIYLNMPVGIAPTLEHVKANRTIDWASFDQKIVGLDKEEYPIRPSSEARLFIRGLMETDPAQRLTMPQALKHNWLRFDDADLYAASPVEDVTMQCTSTAGPGAPEYNDDDTDVTPTPTTRRHATAPAVAPRPLPLPNNKGCTRERQADVLARARQGNSLYTLSPEQLERVAASCTEPGPGPSGGNKRKHGTLTPPPAEDMDSDAGTGTTWNTLSHFSTGSPPPEPVMKKGRSVEPEEMDVSPEKKAGRRRGG